LVLFRVANSRKFEVHVFLGTGVAMAENGGFIPGARYSLLIFSRQPKDEEGDARLAREAAATAGWKNVELEQSRRLSSATQPGDPTLREALGEALSEGCSVVAHRRRLARESPAAPQPPVPEPKL
jgi:hypothetical protein